MSPLPQTHFLTKSTWTLEKIDITYSLEEKTSGGRAGDSLKNKNVGKKGKVVSLLTLMAQGVNGLLVCQQGTLVSFPLPGRLFSPAASLSHCPAEAHEKAAETEQAREPAWPTPGEAGPVNIC